MWGRRVTDDPRYLTVLPAVPRLLGGGETVATIDANLSGIVDLTSAGTDLTPVARSLVVLSGFVQIYHRITPVRLSSSCMPIRRRTEYC